MQCEHAGNLPSHLICGSQGQLEPSAINRLSYFLLSTHVASLYAQLEPLRSDWQFFPTHSRNAPSLWVILIHTPLIIAVAENGPRKDGGYRRAIGVVGAKDLWWLRHVVGRHVEAVAIVAVCCLLHCRHCQLKRDI
jgi:hypothetical protein